MKARVARFVRRWWDGRAGLAGRLASLGTAPLSWAYGVSSALRNRSFDQRGGTRVEGIRVVSVGNLTVGGTGKTPIAAWIARRFAQRGSRVATLARGYGRDELLLHERWNPDVPVVADADRVAAARRALAAGVSVAVLDDGFQHRRLARDLDLVLLSVEDPFPGHLLPRGPYRESPEGLDRSDAVILTRRTESSAQAEALAERVERSFPGRVKASLCLVAGTWQDLEGLSARPPEGALLAVAAVARPSLFSDAVRDATGDEPELIPFPDHHEYALRDVTDLLSRAAGRTIVTTEKDAVKLVAYAETLPEIRVLAQELRWDWGEPDIQALLDDVVQDQESP